MDEALLLNVSDLGTIERLIEVRRYLESLNVVENVRVALIRQTHDPGGQSRECSALVV